MRTWIMSVLLSLLPAVFVAGLLFVLLSWGLTNADIAAGVYYKVKVACLGIFVVLVMLGSFMLRRFLFNREKT